MKLGSAIGLLLAFLSTHATGAAPAPFDSNEARQALDNAAQLIVVTTNDWQSSNGLLRRFQRSAANGWQQVGKGVPVVVGKTGLAWGIGLHGNAPAGSPAKHEGDGKAPAGLFALGPVFGYDPPKTPFVQQLHMPYVQADSTLECVDDPDSRFYNKLVERNDTTNGWKSSEKMLRRDHLYRWGVVVAHNTQPPQPGSGSCIFLHVWRAPERPTVGCTAMQQAELEEAIAWLDASMHPLLLQLPEKEYATARSAWALP